MKNAWLIALREYAENAKTKGFWISIAFFPLFIWASIAVPRLLEEKARQTRYFAMVDHSQEFGKIVDASIAAEYERKKSELALAAFNAAREKGTSVEDYKSPKEFFRHVELPPDVDPSTPESLRTTMRPYLIGDKKFMVDGQERELFALVVLPADVGTRMKGVEYWATNQADDDLRDAVVKGINDELRRREYQKGGLSADEVQRIAKLEVKVDSKDPKKEAGKEGVDEMEKLRQFAPVGFVYLLFVALMTVAQMLLNNCVEEKSNRIVEVLLSSVTPMELMFGKLIGIAAIGFTMLASWLLGGLLVVRASTDSGGKIFDFVYNVLLTPQLLGSFLVYFALGYMLYASIFLAVGSMCNTLKDAQNFMGPIMIVMIVPLLTMMFIAKDPNGTLAVVLSWIPVFTPFVMMNRAAASPPMFEVVGTTLLLAVSVVIVIWIAARIFRTGILRTGQPPKLFEVLRWLRT